MGQHLVGVAGLSIAMLALTMRQLALLLQAGASQPVDQHYQDVWSVVDRYGLPMAILTVMFWFGYRIFWPFMLTLVAANQETMKSELAHAREEMKLQGEVFVAALTRRDEVMQAGFTSMHDHVTRSFEALRAELYGKDRSKSE